MLAAFGALPSRAQTCGNATLNGTYIYQLGGAVATTGGTVAYAELGKLVANGNGSVSGQSTASVGGAIATYTLAGSYIIQGNCTGTLLLSVNSQAPETLTFQVVNGGLNALVAISSSGEVVVGRAYLAASAGQCSNASLAGTYGYALSGSLGGFLYSDAGQVVFNGNGALTTQSVVNTGGGGTQSSGVGSYFVASDCTGTAQVANANGTTHYALAAVAGGTVLYMISDPASIVAGTAQPQLIQSILPDFVFGGGWSSTLYFANTTGNAVSFPVAFVGDDGNPMVVPSVGGSLATVILEPNGIASIQTSNGGVLTQGYALASLPAGVTGYGVFDYSTPGASIQEAVAPLSSASATRGTLVFDDTNFLTAVAIVNPSAAATSVTITLTSAAGTPLGTATVALGARSKSAVVLRTLPGLGAIAGNQGTAVFTVASGNVAVMGIRYTGAAYTSIPTTQQ
jgi:hypothetical protein